MATPFGKVDVIFGRSPKTLIFLIIRRDGICKVAAISQSFTQTEGEEFQVRSSFQPVPQAVPGLSFARSIISLKRSLDFGCARTATRVVGNFAFRHETRAEGIIDRKSVV